MSAWKAAVPREKPAIGMLHFVIAIKRRFGSRYELSGTLSDDDGIKLWKYANELSAKTQRSCPDEPAK